MKKVALINPGREEWFSANEPLNLGFIAGFLEKNGAEARIIDELAGQDVKKELEEYRPDIVGITAVTPLVGRAYQIAELCRKLGILTVMGGVHASILPEEALKHADIIIRGEGEEAMLAIAKGEIDSGIVSKPYIKDIDDIPPPARHLMQMDFYLRTRDRLPDTYLDFVPAHTKTASILTSRGCPFSCTFCHNSWKGLPWRFNSAKRVVSEIKELVEVYDIGALFFIEDNFFANRARVRKICELLKEENINIIWGASARVNGIDLEILQLAKTAGCRQVTFGFESGSQRILDVLNKGTTVEQNKRAIELCNEAGIIPQGTVMIGNPTETIEDIRATQRFLRESDIKSVGVCITTPFPGTKIWEWCQERGLIPESAAFDWSDFLYDRISIPACDTIGPEEIKRLAQETADIIQERVPFKLSNFAKKSLRHPGLALTQISHAFKNPGRAIRFIKKMRF